MPYVPPRESSRFSSPMLTQEILDSVAAQAALTPSYLLYMTASGVLAAVALLSDSVPILVGSMVVAPALAPLALVPSPSSPTGAPWRCEGWASRCSVWPSPSPPRPPPRP